MDTVILTNNEASQTTIDIRGQGDSKNILHVQPYITEEKKMDRTPDVVKRQSSASTPVLSSTASTIFVPYITKATRGRDFLDEMKRKISQTFMKQQTYQTDTNNPKSSYVPGTDYEYRTPGAHYKNKNGKIKRPMNAFMVWARDYRGHLASSMLNATNSEISVKLGQIWASMAPEEKKQYYDTAEKIKAKHRKDYPDWVYQPSAQTLKKREDAQVYTRTPTPPLNQMFTELGQTGSVFNRTTLTTSGDQVQVLASNADKQQNTALFKQSTCGNTGQDGSSTELPSVQSCKVDLNSEMHQKNSQDGVYTTCITPRSVTNSNNVKPLYMSRVSYQSTLEIPRENTVSDTTRGLLASKIAQGRSPEVFRTPSAILAKQSNQQQGSNTPTAAIHVIQSPVRPVRLWSPGASSLTMSMHATQQPRILGIVRPPPVGTLHVQNNVRLHAVRPSLLQELVPHAQMSTHLIAGSQERLPQMTSDINQQIPRLVAGTPQTTFHLQNQSPQITPGTLHGENVIHQSTPQIFQNRARIGRKYPTDCAPQDIPIVETAISPLSAHVRAVSYSSKPDSLSSNIHAKLASRKLSPCTEETVDESELQTTISEERNTTCNNLDLGAELPKESPLLICDDPLQKETDRFWPFPFSENPDDWDFKAKEIPASLCMELFDPYDPFLAQDTLSDKFPGSLELDMDRWKRYLEEDEDGDKLDPLEPLKEEKADDFILSPLPLKQTLRRLLNSHVQESDSGEIITGDVMTEANLNEEDNDDEFEGSELLTMDMTIALSRDLQNCNKEINQKVVDRSANRILENVNFEHIGPSESAFKEEIQHEPEVEEKKTEIERAVNEKFYSKISLKSTSEQRKCTRNCDSKILKNVVEPKVNAVERNDVVKSKKVESACEVDSSDVKFSKCEKILRESKHSTADTNSNEVEKNSVEEANGSDNIIKENSSENMVNLHNTRSQTRPCKLSL